MEMQLSRSGESSQTEQFGWAEIDPEGPVVAGSYGSWRLTYTAGSRGLNQGGGIRVYTDSDTDWGLPQFDDPSAENFITVETPHSVQVALVVNDVSSLRVTLVSGRLEPGHTIALLYGDRSGGGPGSRAQTFRDTRRRFWIDVDVNGDGSAVRLDSSPWLEVMGGEANRLVVIAPSSGRVGSEFRLLVKAEDVWGNPASLYRGTVQLEAQGAKFPVSKHTFVGEDQGVHWLEGCQWLTPGVHRVLVRDSDGSMTAESNPVICTDASSPHHVYWGDPHGGQLRLAERIPEFFSYARDIAGIDFVGYQRNDEQLANSDWQQQQLAEAEFDDPGRFVPLPGFEWSAEAGCGGHHNVYFRRHGQPIRRSSHASLKDTSDIATDLPHVRDLYQAYRFSDVVIIPHVGGWAAELEHHDPTLEPAIEVASTHGTFEWFLEEALEHRYRVGFIGGSDGYTGRPGAEFPGYLDRRFAKGGLTALFAEELSLTSLMDALKARRCYGTTGARILLKLGADGHLMGEEYRTTHRPVLSVSVVGTSALEAVELFRGLERVYSHPLALKLVPNRIRVVWDGASHKASYSAVVWDGQLSLQGARILSVQELRFDSPRSHLFGMTSESLRWHSETCGYRSGLVLDLDTTCQAKLRLVVSTSLVTRPYFGGHGDRVPFRMSYSPADKLECRFDLSDLTGQPLKVDLGILKRRVEVSPGIDAASEAAATFILEDPDPRPGVNPYWVRVLQADGEMAWSSPVFVGYCV